MIGGVIVIIDAILLITILLLLVYLLDVACEDAVQQFVDCIDQDIIGTIGIGIAIGIAVGLQYGDNVVMTSQCGQLGQRQRYAAVILLLLLHCCCCCILSSIMPIGSSHDAIGTAHDQFSHTGSSTAAPPQGSQGHAHAAQHRNAHTAIAAARLPIQPTEHILQPRDVLLILIGAATATAIVQHGGRYVYGQQREVGEGLGVCGVLCQQGWEGLQELGAAVVVVVVVYLYGVVQHADQYAGFDHVHPCLCRT